MGIRALRSYRGGSSGARVVDVALPSLLLAGSIGLGALGLLRGALLHIFFALLGTAPGNAAANCLPASMHLYRKSTVARSPTQRLMMRNSASMAT